MRGGPLFVPGNSNVEDELEGNSPCLAAAGLFRSFSSGRWPGEHCLFLEVFARGNAGRASSSLRVVLSSSLVTRFSARQPHAWQLHSEGLASLGCQQALAARQALPALADRGGGAGSASVSMAAGKGKAAVAANQATLPPLGEAKPGAQASLGVPRSMAVAWERQPILGGAAPWAASACSSASACWQTAAWSGSCCTSYFSPAGHTLFCSTCSPCWPAFLILSSTCGGMKRISPEELAELLRCIAEAPLDE